MSDLHLISEIRDTFNSWWYAYDLADFDAWPNFFTADVIYSSRGDSESHALAEFVTASATGRDEFIAIQREHRSESPFPLRHHATNLHVYPETESEYAFRSYLLVTQVSEGAAQVIVSARCSGAARVEEGRFRICRLEVVLDLTDSEPLRSLSQVGEAHSVGLRREGVADAQI